ncbi:ABC transporter substrate-binding protein [Actinophytocola sp.]|uniref:ABC transporter substrate-binding protein n=1 Tax=Actinophytocola sp. TaxID=1872138 RepID=UPI002DDD6AC2|nr:ABC transporter substrate-binding protein [Actinophytocola sp.]
MCRHRPHWTVFLLVLACVLSGCGRDADESALAGPELNKITVGVLPIVDSASLYLAMRNGYFAEEGLEVEVKTLAGGAAAVPGLRNDEVQFALGNYVSFFAAQAAGALDVKLVADAYQASPGTFMIMVSRDSPMRKARDLAGKKIAVNTRANVVELTARSALQTAGVDPDTVTFVPIPFPEMTAALVGGAVDAAVMVEPYITQAQKDHGVLPMIDVMSGPTAQFPIAAWVATAKLATEKPNTVHAFQRAIIKGQAAAANNRVEVERVLTEFVKVDTITVSLMQLGTWPTTLEETRIQRVVDLMTSAGQLPKPIDVHSMIIPPPA